MCTISDALKLCSYKAKSAHQLQNYWVLYRRNKNKNIMIVGEIILPSFEWFHPNEYKTNYATLENSLNEGNVFDVPMEFKAKDVLELVFNNNDDFKRATYGFKYYKKQWIKSAQCPFTLAGHFDELQFGTIKK